MKKITFGYLALLGICSLLFFGIRAYSFSQSYSQPVYHNEDGVAYFAKVEGKKFLVYDTNGQWTNNFLAGVDIGAGKPGYYPGDLAITKDEYFRWFQQIAEMNANVIRIYTLQSPAFYEAFYQYSKTADSPLYLIQGVYINEAEVAKYKNAYAAGSSLGEEFRQDITDAIDIIHGNAVLTAQAGRASGIYTYDVSPYVVGWILGIEWDSDFVIGTNIANPEKTSFTGQYVYTANASPFEVFLAEMAELTVSYETEHYNMQRPVALCNWPTTDPLTHPNEPLAEKEDIVSVDAEHICATAAFEPGFFASYHVYPYYPDFMSYETKYQVEGSNPYREYLKELTAYHSIPVLVAEFGLPTSRGKAHSNQITGLSQGNNSEQEQGDGIVSMLTDIYGTGCMGGIVFSWQDEWFKTTWNTTDFDDATARPNWFNVQSAEENFGILTFDTSKDAVIDGNHQEWADTEIVANNGSEQLSIKYDEGYLYLLAKITDFDNRTYLIPIDTLDGSGSDTNAGSSFARDSDFVLVLDGKEGSCLLIDPYYNPNYKLYGKNLFSDQELALYNTVNSWRFIDIAQVTSRQLYLPETHKTIAKQLFTTGKLRYGISDPNSASYDSLADFYEKDGYVEIRIPWQLLNVADPSSGEILADLHKSTGFTYQKADSFYFGIGKAGAQNISMNAYQLSGWQTPTYHERLKQSYRILQDNFKQYITTVAAADVKGIGSTEAKAARLFYHYFDEKIKGLELVAYLLFFSVSILIYFFVVLIIVNILANRRTKLKLHAKEKVVAWCKIPEADAVKQLDKKYLYSREGINALYEVLTDGTPVQNEKIKAILGQAGYNSYLKKQLHTRNIQDVNLVVKVAAMLELRDFAADIVKIMDAHRTDLDVQYNALLALSLMGCRDLLITVCQSKSYTQVLSYRCLKEIFSVYSGDKRELYRELLNSPDGYIQRISIKVIGVEGFTEFADSLIPMLETDNVNLLSDVIRTLGQLRSSKAGDRIATFICREDWTIRNMVVIALGDIDLQKYSTELEKGLCDKDWWVRYNSAMKICNHENIEEVQARIKQTKDHFAKEILSYAIQKTKLNRRGV